MGGLELRNGRSDILSHLESFISRPFDTNSIHFSSVNLSLRSCENHYVAEDSGTILKGNTQQSGHFIMRPFYQEPVNPNPWGYDVKGSKVAWCSQVVPNLGYTYPQGPFPAEASELHERKIRGLICTHSTENMEGFRTGRRDCTHRSYIVACSSKHQGEGSKLGPSHAVCASYPRTGNHSEISPLEQEALSWDWIRPQVMFPDIYSTVLKTECFVLVALIVPRKPISTPVKLKT
uniref:Uncharacterized protein n=1 Tax=Sphaerodactylus townsendi TaxID=933632 RepID=A0ACB8E6B9_9SAUR